MSVTLTQTSAGIERLPARFVTFAGAGQHDIATQLQYVRLGTDGRALGPSTWGKTDFEPDREELVDVVINDARGREDQFALDTHGFQLAKHKTSLVKDDYQDEAKIKDVYYKEIEDVVKRISGASTAKVIHHVLRNSTSPNQDDLKLTRPLYKVHVDSSEKRVRDTIDMVFKGKDHAPDLSKQRFGLINVWRPLRKCLRDPLGYCDGSTVPDKDFVARELVMPGGADRKENTAIAKGPGHKWYYLYGQDVDEIVLIRCWDSKDGIVKRCPHSAIRDPSMESMADRESIEVRCLVFWDE